MNTPQNNPSEKYPFLLDEKTFKEVFLKDLQKWLREYRNELPDDLVVTGSPDYQKYKCRNNWFNAFVNTLRIAVPLLPEQLQQETIYYIENTFEKTDWQKRRTKEDIDNANTILAKIVEFFETAS